MRKLDDITINCNKCGEKYAFDDKSYEYFDVWECHNCGYWTYRLSQACCRNPIASLKLKKLNNGQRFIYKQCLNCGGKMPSINLKFKLFENKIEGLWDEEVYNKRYDKLKKEQKILRDKKDYYDENESRFAFYQNHINSAKWRNIREKVLERDKFLCQKCKENDAEEVHHITYDNIGDEKMDDLMSVCRECHSEIHRY